MKLYTTNLCKNYETAILKLLKFQINKIIRNFTP